MIRCRGLCSGYHGRAVLGGVDLDVAAGEMVGILGPNGAGKTTLLLTLSGVLSPGGGTVRLGGRDIAAMADRERARRVAAVPQRSESVQELTVRSLVLMGRYPYLSFLGRYGPADEAAAAAAMDAVGVTGLAGRRLGELSGGEFQRVLAARALAQESDILLLDEASASLDIARKMELYQLLAARNAAGTTILAALHDINLAALYCRRLVFFKNGRIEADGPTAAVFTQPTLSRIYETDIVVIPHPQTGTPQALAVPGPGPGPDAGPGPG
ncbi:ABC transporter ATP-binding protein [Solidesulfovibrio sp.]